VTLIRKFQEKINISQSSKLFEQTFLLMEKKAQFCTLFQVAFQPHFYKPSPNGISKRELFKNSRNLLF
jgi:hypothetical protein